MELTQKPMHQTEELFLIYSSSFSESKNYYTYE